MRTMRKRWIAAMLSLIMCLSVCVVPVYAQESTETESTDETPIEVIENTMETEESQIEESFMDEVEQTEGSYEAETNFVIDIWFTSSTKETDVVSDAALSKPLYIWYKAYDTISGKTYDKFDTNYKVYITIDDADGGSWVRQQEVSRASKSYYAFTPSKLNDYVVKYNLYDRYGKNKASGETTFSVYEGYTVSFSANGGTGAPASQTKKSNAPLTLTTEKPQPKSYTIYYYGNGGTVSETTKTVTAEFKHWNTSASGSGTSYASGGIYDKNSAVTLYAIWQASAGTLLTPTRDGYVFDGWYTSSSGGTKVTADTEITKTTFLYAHWTKIGSTFTVTYNANGGTGAPSATTKKEGISVALSTTVPKKSYTVTFDANGGTVSPAKATVNAAFKNWNTSVNGTGTSYAKGASYTRDASVTLYAQWTNPKAGSLPTPTRDKYDFAGWYTAKTGGSKVTSDTVITKNTTIYARWTEKSEDYGNTAKGFVYRLYKLVLGRNPDQVGLNDWTNQLTSGKSTGAEVANGFIYSKELADRKLSNADYVDMLYATFLNRKADSAGRSYWVNYLEKGMSRAYVYRGFANSVEFNAICNEYGIKAGSVVLTEPKDQNEGVTMFVYRCYEKFLGRKPDDAGLNDWCNRLLTGAINPKEAAYGFVMSNEFMSKNLSNEDYVKIMYLGLFDRAADSVGLADWAGKLDEGNSRESIFYGFADSQEFRALARSFGLNGDWPATPVKYVTGAKTFVQILMNNKSKWQMSKSTGSGGYFEPCYSLIDLDLDGQPELVVTGLGGTQHNAPTAIWRVQNGTMVKISQSYAAGETGEIQNLSLYKNKSTGKYIYVDKAIVSAGSYGSSTLHVELTLNGNSVTSYVRFQEDVIRSVGREYYCSGAKVSQSTYTSRYNSYFGNLVNAQLSYGKVTNAQWHKLDTTQQTNKLMEMYGQFSYN